VIRELLEASLSRRTFWDFYAVYALGLDSDEVDADGIVNEAWESVFSEITKAVFRRWATSAVVAIAGIDYTEIEFDPNGWYSKSTLARLPENLQDLVRKEASTSEQLSVIRFALDHIKALDGKDLDYVTSSNGTWGTLASRISEEAKRANQSRAAKAMSVDRMLAWTHHSGPIAEHISRWLPDALDARSRADAKTLLAHASPDVRSALRSAAHGVGSKEPMSWADQFEAWLNRHSRVFKVERRQNLVGFVKGTQRFDQETGEFDMTGRDFHLVKFEGDRATDMFSDKEFPRITETMGGRQYENKFSYWLGQLDGSPTSNGDTIADYLYGKGT